MRYIADSKEMKEIEAYAIDTVGIPSLVLMERAALSVSKVIKERFSKQDRICVVCGTGNNGGDGAAIARQLLEDEYKADVVVLGNKNKFTSEMKTQTDILKNMDIPLETKIPDKDYACFVDALFGIGLKRNITDDSFVKAIETINLSGAYIYSVDIPSGVNTDTGHIMGCAVKADETITFTCEKTGLCVYPGKEYAGKVFLKDIGILSKWAEKTGTKHFGYDKYEVAPFLKRDENGNKGTFGKVVVIAGNQEISGAAYLCAAAVLKCGAGMVKVLSHGKTLDIIRKSLPEAMTQSLDDERTMEDDIKAAIGWADCVVIGPGIGTDKMAYYKMKYVLERFPDAKKLVIDADGINLIAGFSELKELTNRVNNIIYTPHMQELSRLTSVNIAVLKANTEQIMSQIIKEDRAVYVCKDSVTRVYQRGKGIFINRYGNSGMATAGTGDVLAGVIAAMVAKKETDVYEGAVTGVHIHSLAGDLAAEECSKTGLLAGDIIKALPVIFKTMEEFI